MIITILLRYLGTIAQFIVLASISRSLAVDEYGLYLLCIGVTFSFYCLVGGGASEGAIIDISSKLAVNSMADVSKLVMPVLAASTASISIIAMACIVMILFLPMSSDGISAVVFTCVFISANGVAFNISQILMGLGRKRLGAFFYYPAINLSLLIFTVPVALLNDNVRFSTIVMMSSLGGLVVATAAVILCMIDTRINLLRISFKDVGKSIASGAGLTAVRMLHVSSFWIPTMVCGLVLDTSQAGIMGTAGRLAIAVSAVIAAVRFFIRPAMCKALALNRLNELNVAMRSIAFFTTSISFFALFANLLFGEVLIVLFFGDEMREASSILNILLIGVCAESVFGPIDEFLKVAGYKHAVVLIYRIAVPIFLGLCLIFAHIGLVSVAWIQVFFVFSIFLIMNLKVKRNFGFYVYPNIPNCRVLARVTNASEMIQ